MYELIDALKNSQPRDSIPDHLETIPFFADFLKNEKIKSNARHLLKEFSAYLNLEYFVKDETIFKAGERGDKFYIVLIGAVDIYKNRQDSMELSSPSRNYIPFNREEHIKIATVKPGEQFGELALMYNKPRFATAIAAEDTTACSLSKENYIKMTYYQQRELDLKTRSLQLIFPKLSQNQLIRLGYQLQLLSFKAGHYIIRQGQEPTGFYIISQGEVKLEQFKVSGTQKYIPIRVLTPGSTFGVQELLVHKSTEYNAISVTEQVVVYKFTSEMFDSLADEVSQKALALIEKVTRRQPKIIKQQAEEKIKHKISLRDMAESRPVSRNSNYISNVNHTERSMQSKYIKFHHRVSSKHPITFRNPFFSDLDPEKFTQIKKIAIDQQKQQNRKLYNDQYSIDKFFKPIDWGSIVQAKVQDRLTQQLMTARDTKSNSYLFPASGYSSHRALKK